MNGKPVDYEPNERDKFTEFSSVMQLVSPAAFWPLDYLTSSAWLEHAPFAFWFASMHLPSSFVELGTQAGFSYFSVCQAVQKLDISTKCYAVDTWKGDEHAGHYDEQAFQTVSALNAEKYSTFSRLLRCTFNEALPHFSNNSIDLLHIDGRHFYEDVKDDFESWLPKLSERGVVLFHDTNVRERKFGVYKLWEELTAKYPSFEFYHGNGLGVLGVGQNLPTSIVSLLTLDTQAAVGLRNIYARLGANVSLQMHAKLLEMEVNRHASQIESQNKVAEQQKSHIQDQAWQLNELATALDKRVVEIAELEARLKALENSTIWRSTKPIREALTLVRRPFR